MNSSLSFTLSIVAAFVSRGLLFCIHTFTLVSPLLVSRARFLARKCLKRLISIMVSFCCSRTLFVQRYSFAPKLKWDRWKASCTLYFLHCTTNACVSVGKCENRIMYYFASLFRDLLVTSLIRSKWVCVCIYAYVSLCLYSSCISPDSRSLILRIFSVAVSTHSVHAILSNVKTNYINQFDERKYTYSVLAVFVPKKQTVTDAHARMQTNSRKNKSLAEKRTICCTVLNLI